MRPVTLPARGTALLLIDVVNDLAFEGSEALIAQAEPMALRVAALKRRAARAGVPVIYVNDNFGQWRSDFRRTVRIARRAPHRAARVAPSASDDPGLLRAQAEALGVLRHDAGYAAGRSADRRLVLAGIAGNICVLFTANDAYMRGFRLYVPEDCIVSNTPEDNAYALRQIATVMKGHTQSSTLLRFRGGTARRRSQPTASRR